jgi:hypothetical protein
VKVKHDKRFVTKAEAIAYGRISPSTLRRLLNAKALKRYKRPGERRILIDRAELDAILQPREIPA